MTRYRKGSIVAYSMISIIGINPVIRPVIRSENATPLTIRTVGILYVSRSIDL
jgi:hypothetical protein